MQYYSTWGGYVGWGWGDGGYSSPHVPSIPQSMIRTTQTANSDSFFSFNDQVAQIVLLLNNESFVITLFSISTDRGKLFWNNRKKLKNIFCFAGFYF